MVMITLSVLDQKYYFWAKLSVEEEIWYQDLLEYVKFDVDVHHFLFRLELPF